MLPPREGGFEDLGVEDFDERVLVRGAAEAGSSRESERRRELGEAVLKPSRSADWTLPDLRQRDLVSLRFCGRRTSAHSLGLVGRDGGGVRSGGGDRIRSFPKDSHDSRARYGRSVTAAVWRGESDSSERSEAFAERIRGNRTRQAGNWISRELLARANSLSLYRVCCHLKNAMKHGAVLSDPRKVQECQSRNSLFMINGDRFI